MMIFCPRCKREMRSYLDHRTLIARDPAGRAYAVDACVVCAPDVEDVQDGKAEPIWPEEFDR